MELFMISAIVGGVWLLVCLVIAALNGFADQFTPNGARESDQEYLFQLGKELPFRGATAFLSNHFLLSLAIIGFGLIGWLLKSTYPNSEFWRSLCIAIVVGLIIELFGSLVLMIRYDYRRTKHSDQLQKQLQRESATVQK